MSPSLALLTDLYELTMVAAYVADGLAERPATFSLFVRSLPPGRGYLVAAGLEPVLAYLETLRFDDEDLAVVDRLGLFEPSFLDYLAAYRFTGGVRAVPEGALVFPGEPLLEVTAPIGQGQLAETYALNQVTVATTLASKAARLRTAAGGRPVIDFGLRRAQGVDAGMALARAARICGLAGTSNVAGASRFRLRASGTMAHSFVQAYGDEREAFQAFARRFGAATVFLVDTYDPHRGVAHAIDVARECREGGVEPRGLRIDSGDLLALSRDARRQLDGAGFPGMQVLVSGGLDEYDIERLVDAGAPIDGFGVGTTLAVSADAPVLDTSYKLVDFDGRPARKTSAGKATWPGRKQVWRHWDDDADTLALAGEPPVPQAEPLLAEVMRDGRRTKPGQADLGAANRTFEEQWARLPEGVRRLHDPDPWPVRPSAALQQLTEELDAAQPS